MDNIYENHFIFLKHISQYCFILLKINKNIFQYIYFYLLKKYIIKKEREGLMDKKRIVILGGGFGGVYTALHLEKYHQSNLEITLVNRENYFVFQPMLAEVVGGSVGILDTVSALRKMLKKTTLLIREIEAIDMAQSEVILAPQFTHSPLKIHYDYLVLALGGITDFSKSPGLQEHAFPFKNLADSLVIRNRVIDAIEAAAIEENPTLKQKLLTFLVGGGGFSGTEIVAEVNDLVRKLIKAYPTIDPKEAKVILVHSKERLLEHELCDNLGRYAEKILRKRGVDIRFNAKLKSATPEEAILDNGERIPCKTVISTVPGAINPLLDQIDLPKIKGRMEAEATLQVKGQKHPVIWAIGDCAAIPHLSNGKGLCPPTAQFAIRQAKVLAHNLVATLKGKECKNFSFKALGMLGALGHRSAVAEMLGFIKCSGFIAWVLWRLIYWMKLPGISRKVKVGISWLLDMVIPSEAVQLKITPSQGVAQLHFETGETIFNEGDVGDYLYIIVDGSVEVLKKVDGASKQIATLGRGEYFGEMALLNQKSRSATIRCTAPTNVLALRAQDFGLLIANLKDLKSSFEETEQNRRKELEK